MGLMGEKSRLGLQRQEVGLLVKRWLDLIDGERKINFGSPPALENA